MQDCRHHFDSEQVCQAERSLKSPLAETERNCCARLAMSNVSSQVTVNFRVYFIQSNRFQVVTYYSLLQAGTM